VGASADILDKMAVKEIEDKLLTLSQIDTVYSPSKMEALL